jgi:hypothetical protein
LQSNFTAQVKNREIEGNKVGFASECPFRRVIQTGHQGKPENHQARHDMRFASFEL